MNRKQRRANGIKDSVRTYTLTNAQIEEIKKNAAKEAIEISLVAMMGLPLIVLRDKFGFGKQRLEKFEESLVEQYKCFDEGYIELDTLKDAIKQETGMEVLR